MSILHRRKFINEHNAAAAAVAAMIPPPWETED